MYTETLVAPLTQVHSRYTVYGSQKNTSLHLSLQQLQLTTKLFCCAQKDNRRGSPIRWTRERGGGLPFLHCYPSK